jgi:hypothetical protein
MEFITQILATTGPIGFGVGLVFLLMVLALKVVWESQKEEREARIKSLDNNNEKYENVVRQMFEVVNANTQALTAHTEVSKELKKSMRELRLPSIQK